MAGRQAGPGHQPQRTDPPYDGERRKRVVIRSPVYTELRSGNVATDASGRVALADLTDTVPQVGKLRGRTVTSGGYEDE